MILENIIELSKPIIKEFEGFRSEAYLDAVGVVTIGWGSTTHADGSKIQMGETWTTFECEARLTAKITEFAKNVINNVKVPLSDKSGAALVSFEYNLGAGALDGSTLLKLLNANDFIGASKEFIRWDRAGGRILKDLLKRRELESQLFLEGIQDATT